MPTILLVEDEQAILEMYRYVLELRGYTVLSAKSGEAALAVSKYCVEPIDVLLSDMTLTPMNGAQLAAAIRAERPFLAVVLMSGSPAHIFPDQSIADRFLQKPFRHWELIKAVEDAFQSSASRKHLDVSAQ